MTLTEFNKESYIDDLPEINNQALLWRKDYFEKIIKSAKVDIEQAELILIEIGKESEARVAKTPSIKYHVHFKLYQYNTGAADNGYYKEQESFDTLDEAKTFLDKLQGWVESDASTTDFAKEYGRYGYLDRVIGMTRTTTFEEKLTRDKEEWEK